MDIDVVGLIEKVEESAVPILRGLNNVSYVNQKKVLHAFQEYRVCPEHFAATTGYGYHDLGRETLEAVFARVFGGEDALVRSQIISGTHAIYACLSALLYQGSTLVSAMGTPYDTLYQVITGSNGLVQRGIGYQEVPVAEDGGCDLQELVRVCHCQPEMVLLQRSRGYSPVRRTLLVREIAEAIGVIKEVSPETIILVDNCYGELVEELEPGDVGADLIAGSLIKNPGGGLAAGGGYVVGRRNLVEAVADYLVAPGLGKEMGPSLFDLRTVFQGFFLAPHVVAEALKGAVVTAGVFGELGFPVSPAMDEPRGDIVQAIGLASREQLEAFVQAVQACSPVESFVRPEFAPMPGYDHEVIMAAGTFVQGSSIELSCDGPLREPYLAFFQGGLGYQHTRYALEQLVKLVQHWSGN